MVKNALAGLFLLNIYFYPNRTYLAKKGIIDYEAKEGLQLLVNILNNHPIER